MCQPKPTKLLQMLTLSQGAHPQLLRALLRCVGAPLDQLCLDVQYFQRIHYQGFLYDLIESFVCANTSSGNTLYGKLTKILCVACVPKPLWVVGINTMRVKQVQVATVGGASTHCCRLTLLAQEGITRPVQACNEHTTLLSLANVAIRPIKVAKISESSHAILEY
jgi:hypothetical protein